MDVIVIELILWVALFFLFWALKDGLGNVESDIEAMGIMKGSRVPVHASRHSFSMPEKLSEPIGTYKDATIYSCAVIDGRRYRFDFIQAEGDNLKDNQKCIAPGLVYVECG